MEEMDYAPLLPTEPPEGLIPWLIQQGKLKKELLIYTAVWTYDPESRRKRKMVELRCTACGGRTTAERVDTEGGCSRAYTSAPFGYQDPETGVAHVSGGDTVCPLCGAKVEVRHIETVRDNWSCVEAYPMTVTAVDGKLALLGWCARKWYTKEGGKGYTVWPYEAYVVEKKKIIRLSGYEKCMGQVRLSGRWEQRKKYYDVWGEADLVYPWKSELLIGTTAENSKLDVYLRESVKNTPRPATYLRLWLAHPQVENLVVQGMSELVSEEIYLASSNYGRNLAVPELKTVNWKEKSPAKMLGMNRDELRVYRERKWDVSTLEFWQERKEKGQSLTADEMKLAEVVGLYHIDRVERDTGMDFRRVGRYLMRQQKKDRRSDVNTLLDYWCMARENGRELDVPEVLLPSNLVRAHDRELNERNRRREETEKAAKAACVAKFEKRLKKLSTLSWERDGILIRPVRDEAELIEEGKKLHHCVATYARRHADGETAIFLVRRAGTPDEPWYTLELDEKNLIVRQNRGKHNCDRLPEVREFEKNWVEHIRAEAARAKKQKKKAKEKEGHAA